MEASNTGVDLELTIIVPHKNSPELLQRLLHTIPQCNDFEVIIVDDNSDEKFKSRLQEISSLPLVKVIWLDESAGAGHARNVGLKYAIGAWVMFADADDCYSENGFAEVRPFFKQQGVDIVYFNVSSIDESGRQSYRHLPYSKLIEEQICGRADERNIRYRHTPPWAKLFRKNFLIENDILFDEIPASNDIYFSIVAGHMAKHIAVCSGVVYVVTQTMGSITNTVSIRNLKSKFNAALRVNRFLRKHDAGEYQHSILYFLYRVWTLDKRLALRMLFVSIQSGNNPFVGWAKLLRVSQAVRQRESR